MTDRPFLITLLIQIAALRSLRDLLVKPLFLVILAVLLGVASDLIVVGQLSMNLLAVAKSSIFSLAPFLIAGLYVVTHLDRSERLLSEMALSDPLTGLPNRRSFLDRTEWLKVAIERDHKGVLMLLDADRFKLINDNWGHPVGDQCLMLIAQRLTDQLRATDVAGRIGGEEFAVFLPGADMAQAEDLGQRLCQPIAVEPKKPAGRLTFTMSIGLAPVTADVPLDDSLRNADVALYRAKENGRGRVEIWTRGMKTAAA